MPETASIIDGVDFQVINTRDVEASTKFYTEVLGLERTAYVPDRGYAAVQLGEISFSIFAPEMMGREFVASESPTALRVNDVEAARAELEAKGVPFSGETIDSGVCHMAFFTDPDGNSMMLHKRYAPGPAS